MVSHGCCLNSLQEDRTKLLKQFERVGLYSDGITETYADWSADKKNMDSYQVLIKAWMELLGPNFHDESNRTLVALRSLIGDFIDPDTGAVMKALGVMGLNP